MKFFGSLFKKDDSKTISEQTLQELGFSDQVLTILNEASNNSLYPFQNYHDVTIGLSFILREEEAEKTVRELRSKILHLGYFPFINETDLGRSNKIRVGIVKTDSQFELLKILDTNGDNYDINNDDVICKLKKWHNRYPFTVIAANFDWVEIDFDKLPTNAELAAFAEEIMEFCPDAAEYEDDEVSIEETMKNIEETKRLYLWWD